MTKKIADRRPLIAENINSPRYIKSLLDLADKKLKKSLGQNFMISPHAVEKLVKAADLKPNDVVVEIGPGLGHLTRVLLEKSRYVIAIEKDLKLAKLFQEEIKEKKERLDLIQGDFLKCDLKEIFLKAQQYLGAQGKVKIVANLPYYITTPVIVLVLESGLAFDSMTVTIQKEVAERMATGPGSKTYGSISVLVQFYSHPAIVGKIKPAAFFPPPKVDSAILNFDLYSEPSVQVKDKQLFFKIVRTCFGKRRKMLRHTLREFSLTEVQLSQIFDSSGIDGKRRPETLSLSEFAQLTNQIDDCLI